MNAELRVFTDNSITQKTVAMLGAIAMKPRLRAHFRDSLLQGLHDGRHEGARHITDAKADDLRLGMRLLVDGNLVRDIREQIILLKFEKILID